MTTDINEDLITRINLLEEDNLITPPVIDVMSLKPYYFTKIVFDPSLSARERSCLFWAANGKNSDEIAKIMQINKKEVKKIKKKIISKLECSNITQAVFQGIRFYLIPK